MDDADTVDGALARAESPPCRYADFRLFAFTWAAAFLFVSVWLG